MKDNQIVKADGGPEYPLSGELINAILEWCRQIGESYYLEELLAEGPVKNFEDLVAFHHRALPRAEARWGCLRGKVARLECGAWVYGYSSFNLYVEEGVVTFTYLDGKGDMFVEHDFAYVLYAESGHSFGRMLSFMEMLRDNGMPVSDGPLVHLEPVPEPDTPDFMWKWVEVTDEPEQFKAAARSTSWDALRPYMAWHGAYVGTVHCYNIGYYTRKGDPKRSRVARRRSRSLRLARRLKSETTER
jgi:hypothetical protein